MPNNERKIPVLQWNYSAFIVWRGRGRLGGAVWFPVPVAGRLQDQKHERRDLFGVVRAGVVDLCASWRYLVACREGSGHIGQMFRRVGRRQFGPLVFVLALLTHAASGATVGGTDGLTVTVQLDGTYSVAVPAMNWLFAGTLGGSLSNLSTAAGTDRIGAYNEISFDWRSDVLRHGAIRVWFGQPAVLFTTTNLSAAANTFSFPNFTRFPQGLYQLTYTGAFAKPQFGVSAPESPWIFFDSSRNAFILSPANNFMTAVTAWGPNGELASGIAPQILSLPQGLQHQTLLVIQNGINRAFDTWGQTLLAVHGKTPPPNDADLTLNKIGYWTDNGSAYYYRTAPGLSYEQTLSSVKADFARQGVGLGYVQLDSWFYPKGPNALWTDNGDGIYEYTADTTLFPQGLPSFQRDLGVPLVTHARWIDPSSPDRTAYQMSGNVVIDPRYWNATAAYLSNSGVATYEQDWLAGGAHADFNLTDPNAFLDNMAAALAQRNISVQYCMASPRHLLQIAKYGNVTTARVSYDRFQRANWTHFLYTSRLARSVGVWPFTDVFNSTQTDDLLLATLSAGPIGIGDPIGVLSGDNLLRAARRDGVIVKPDVALTPIDNSFLNMAAGIDAPQMASTYSDFGQLRTYYIVAYSTGANREAAFRLSDLGIQSPVYLWDYFAAAGRLVGPSDPISSAVPDTLQYWIAAPVGPSGIAVLGDVGEFVSMGKKRIPEVSDDGAVSLTIAFAEGEGSRVIQGYSPERPRISVRDGRVEAVTYDRRNHLFQVTVAPGAGGTASLGIRCRRAPASSVE